MPTLLPTARVRAPPWQGHRASAETICSTPPGSSGHSSTSPKSRAGRRVVAFPTLTVPDLRAHLDALPDGASLALTSPTGSPLRHSNFRRRVWLPALKTAGLSGVHFHDLRHTGNQFVANKGANTRELMERMGHDSERAVLIYLHSSAERSETWPRRRYRRASRACQVQATQGR